MADIFLSYASEDRERIIPLVEVFEAEGFSVWWDRHIGPGASFDLEIERELALASCVVVVWSDHSLRKDWVRDEADEGLERGILVPVRIDDVRPPLGTRRVQMADLKMWPEAEPEQLQQLSDSIRSLVGGLAPDSAEDRELTEPDQIVIAVLPLVDRSSNGNMRYLCEGLAEDLMNALFLIEGVQVLSATDTFQYNNAVTSVKEIGRSLGATVVLEGSVQSAGERLAITSRLVQVRSGITLWSDRYLRGVDDAFEIQSEIATNVVNGLRAKLSLRTTIEPVAVGRSRDPIAYELFQQARTIFQSENDVAKAGLLSIVFLECSVRQDPGFAKAIAELIVRYTYYGDLLTQEEQQANVSALVRQLEVLDRDGPLISDVRASLERDMLVLAKTSAKDILDGKRVHAYVHPTGSDDVRHHYAIALAHTGLPREAIDYFLTVNREQESNYVWSQIHRAQCHTMLGEEDIAIEQYESLRRAARAGTMIGYEFEALCRISIGDLDGADALPVGWAIMKKYLVDPLIGWKRGESVNMPKGHESWKIQEMLAYYNFLTGDADLGFDLFDSAIHLSGEERHWIAFRFLTMRSRFDNTVVDSPLFQTLLPRLGLDPDTREQIRQTVKELTPVTGIVARPLMPL